MNNFMLTKPMFNQWASIGEHCQITINGQLFATLKQALKNASVNDIICVDSYPCYSVMYNDVACNGVRFIGYNMPCMSHIHTEQCTIQFQPEWLYEYHKFVATNIDIKTYVAFSEGTGLAQLWVRTTHQGDFNIGTWRFNHKQYNPYEILELASENIKNWIIPEPTHIQWLDVSEYIKHLLEEK